MLHGRARNMQRSIYLSHDIFQGVCVCVCTHTHTHNLSICDTKSSKVYTRTHTLPHSLTRNLSICDTT